MIPFIDPSISYEKEIMKDIQLHCIYIDNKYSMIDMINLRENLVTQDNFSILSKDAIQSIIHQYRHYKNKKYKFIESILYNIDIDTNQIESYNNDNTTNNMNFLTILPNTHSTNITISPSLSFFHTTNCLFLLFQDSFQQTKKKYPPLSLSNDLLSRKKTRKLLTIH